MYKLYVIPGSHACRSAMLMLEHKRVPYRARGVRDAHASGLPPGCTGSTRAARRAPPAGSDRSGLRMGDRIGTVPGLKAGERAHLDELRDRPLPGRAAPGPAAVPGRPRGAGGGGGGGAVGERTAPDGRPPHPRARPSARDPETFGRSTGDGRTGPPALQARAHAAGDDPVARAAASSPPARTRSATRPTSCPRCSTGSTRGSPTGCWAGRSSTPRTSWSRPAWR